MSRQYYENAIRIFNAKLGPKHPKIAFVKINLGDIFRKTSDYQNALNIYQEALETIKIAIGSERKKNLKFLKKDIFSIFIYFFLDYLGRITTKLG